MNYDVDSYYRSAMKVRPALFPSPLTPLLPLEYPSFSPIFVSGHPLRGPSLLVQGIFLEETNPSMFNPAFFFIKAFIILAPLSLPVRVEPVPEATRRDRRRGRDAWCFLSTNSSIVLGEKAGGNGGREGGRRKGTRKGDSLILLLPFLSPFISALDCSNFTRRSKHSL